VATALAAACAAAGCGGDSGTVSGKVVYNGTPVKGGVVSFIDGGWHAVNAEIKPDGSYSASKVPLGDVKVTVATPKTATPNAGAPSYEVPSSFQNPNAAPASGGPNDVVQVPATYGDPEKTTLKYTVKPGSQTYDPPLK
jgi:hypothetical protein